MLNNDKEVKCYNLLPLRGTVVFPNSVIPLSIGRSYSIEAIDNAYHETAGKYIVLLTQKDTDSDDPEAGEEDFYSVGVLGVIKSVLKIPRGIVKVIIETKHRVKIKNFIQSRPFFTVNVEDVAEDIIEEDEEVIAQIEALKRTAIEGFKKYSKLSDSVAPEVLTKMQTINDIDVLADFIAANLSSDLFEMHEKQAILAAESVYTRLEKICKLIAIGINVVDTRSKIKTRVKSQMEDTHKKYYLNEQLKAIQKELGGNSDSTDFNEVTDFEKKIDSIKLTKEAREKALDELRKFKMMNSVSAEATVIRNYLDYLLSLPWSTFSRIKSNLQNAKDVLDSEHYGMEKVKDRILEYLAVQQRVKKVKGSILCLIGPPGVGKTSLVKSIAKATGRNFSRIALGGISDESEIRGHRRTYIGSMPGKIIQCMKKAKTTNPLMLLDEIDKIGSDFRGDPAAALLEILDTEQNHSFVDHYIEVEYDLSNVMFVATANNASKIPYALRDRLEMIYLSGYTEDEKVSISKKHLMLKVLKDTGLKNIEFSISEDALYDLIRYYTKESGVRGLKRELESLGRKILLEILNNKIKKAIISVRNLKKYAGTRKFSFGEAEQDSEVGVVTGLAYTEVGGELLAIEAVSLPGKGNIKCTGKLGEVMQESVQAAHSFVCSRCLQYGIIPSYYSKRDIHVHVPEGAIPKDGPSAGIAMTVAIVSVLTGIAVNNFVAMTGEVTLSGRVLPIGGLKEKLLAALRGGIKTAIIPAKNEKDLDEIPNNVKRGIDIKFVSTVEEVLEIALCSSLQPINYIINDEVSDYEENNSFLND